MQPEPEKKGLWHRQLNEPLRRGDRALDRAMSGNIRVYKAHELIIRAGADDRSMYRLRSGWAFEARMTADGRRQILNVALPGDLIGLNTIVVVRSPANVACATRVSANVIDYVRLMEVTAADANMALCLIWRLGREQCRLRDWVFGLGQCSAEERAAAMLLDFGGRLDMLGAARRDGFRMPLTQQQIGNYLGITDVHVNRVLRRWRDAGIALIAGGVVKIGDIDQLKRIAAPMREFWESERALR
jgi:CRP-like cAMP-binding protein